MSMKKIFLFATALFAAVTLNAREITVDLSTATEIAYTNCSATFAVADGALNVNYTAGAWEWAGVEFDLDNLEAVTSMSFEFKGQTPNEWTSFIIYLRDSEGARWYDDADDFSLSQAEWLSKTGYLPTKLCWDAANYAFGERPFTKLGFMANPMAAESSSFAIRNVRLYVSDDETAISNVASAAKAVKEIRNGQVVILRGDKVFNALGAEMK